VALAGLLSAIRAKGVNNPNGLVDERIVVLGAGSAGLGVASGILYCMTQMGIGEEEARKRFWIADNLGSLGRGRTPAAVAQTLWIRHDIEDQLSLLELVKKVQPTVLIGLTGVPGLFSEAVVKEMSRHADRPIIFPLSNPTDRAECTAQKAYEWTNGRAIVASGSPFLPVTLNDKTYYPSQANNMFAFPGIGLGAISCHASIISPKMLNAVSVTLSQAVTDLDLKECKLFPRLSGIRKVSEEIAFALASTAYEEGLANSKYDGPHVLREKIKSNMWDPAYGSLVRVDSNY